MLYTMIEQPKGLLKGTTTTTPFGGGEDYMEWEEIRKLHPWLPKKSDGYHQHENGGGWVSDDSKVSPDSYIGEDCVVANKSRVTARSRVTEGTAVTRGGQIGRASCRGRV